MKTENKLKRDQLITDGCDQCVDQMRSWSRSTSSTAVWGRRRRRRGGVEAEVAGTPPV